MPHKDGIFPILKVTKHAHFNAIFLQHLNKPDLHLQKFWNVLIDGNIFNKIKCAKIPLKSLKNWKFCRDFATPKHKFRGADKLKKC